jgi:hypothetical protein
MNYFIKFSLTANLELFSVPISGNYKIDFFVHLTIELKI